MKNIVVHDQLPSCSISGLQHRTLISPQDGATEIAVWEQILYPGATTPLWRHNYEAAVVVLAGEGEFISNATTTIFIAPCSLIVAAGSEHRLRNIGEGNLTVLMSFATAQPKTTVVDDPVVLPWQSEQCVKQVIG